MSWKIAVIPGDGIGREVVPAAVDTLPPDVELTYLDVGANRYLATGELLTAADFEAIRDSDAVLFGAVGDPRVPDGVLERGVILELRRELDLYVNLRPVPELDLVIVRENTEGAYADMGDRDEKSAVEISLNTRPAIERCARYAFELAATRRGHVTLAHKTNVLTFAGSLWRDVVSEVATNYPQITLAYAHADAAAYHLVVEPDRFDVIVTDNLFGDVLSDVAAGAGGGLGKAASANIHPDPTTRRGRCIGLFEPVHGSAPDIAGTGRADPTAAIEAARMLIQHLTKEGVAA